MSLCSSWLTHNNQLWLENRTDLIFSSCFWLIWARVHWASRRWVSSSSTLNSSASITRLSSVGKVSPRCHLNIVCLLTKRTFCISCIDRPLSLRSLLIFLPVSTVFIVGMVVIFNPSFHEKTAWCIILQIRRPIIPIIVSGPIIPLVCSSHDENLHHTGI